MDLAPELRNQIYEEYVSTFRERPLVKPNNLKKTTCKTIFTLVMALGLQNSFPLVFASKRIMLEVLGFCIRTCSLHLQDRAQLEAIRNVQHLCNFNKIAANVRELTLDLSWFGQGILDPHPHSLWSTLR